MTEDEIRADERRHVLAILAAILGHDADQLASWVETKENSVYFEDAPPRTPQEQTEIDRFIAHQSRAGRATSEAKKASSAANGAKGGRPKKKETPSPPA